MLFPASVGISTPTTNLDTEFGGLTVVGTSSVVVVVVAVLVVVVVVVVVVSGVCWC